MQLKNYEFLIYLKYRDGLFGSVSFFQVPYMHNPIPTSTVVKDREETIIMTAEEGEIADLLQLIKGHKTYDRKMLPSTGIARAVTALTWPLNTWMQLLNMGKINKMTKPMGFFLSYDLTCWKRGPTL